MTAHCQRDDDWWIVDVPEVEGALTQGRTLDEAAFMAADAVGLLLDVDPATVEVRLVTEPFRPAEPAPRGHRSAQRS